MLCVTRCRRPVMNVSNTTSGSSHMPSTDRLPHQAHTVTLSGNSCRDGARGPGAPAAASETRAGSLMIERHFCPLLRDRQVRADEAARDGAEPGPKLKGFANAPAEAARLI
jgi:hypothetical protein